MNTFLDGIKSCQHPSIFMSQNPIEAIKRLPAIYRSSGSCVYSWDRCKLFKLLEFVALCTSAAATAAATAAANAAAAMCSAP